MDKVKLQLPAKKFLSLEIYDKMR